MVTKKWTIAAICSLYMFIGGCGNAANAVKTANDAAGFAGNGGVGNTRHEITTQSIQVDTAAKTMFVLLGSTAATTAEHRGTYFVRPRSGGVRNNVMSFIVPVGWTVRVVGPKSHDWHGNVSIQPFPANRSAPDVSQAGGHTGRAVPYSNVTGTWFTAHMPGDYAIVATGQGQNNRILEVFTVSEKIQVPGISNNPFQRTGRR